jgi:type II secretory pathway component PulF
VAQSFSGVYVAMVRAGEAGGFLDVVLGQIAEFRAREADLKGKVKASLVYPVFLAVLATGVVVFLLAWFIPKFSTSSRSSAATCHAHAVHHRRQQRRQVVRAGPRRRRGSGRVRAAPQPDDRRRAAPARPLAAGGAGPGARQRPLRAGRFCRMLGTLVGAGVPIVASLRVAREAIGSQTLADTVNHAIEEVQRGTALAKSLAASPQLFPASVVETIAVARKRGA